MKRQKSAKKRVRNYAKKPRIREERAPQQVGLKSALYGGHSTAAEDAAILRKTSELVKTFLFDVLDKTQVVRIATQKRVDFCGTEHTSLLVCRILRLAGFAENEIVPKEDVVPLLSFARQRILNKRYLLMANKHSVVAKEHLNKLYDDPCYCDVLLKVPYTLFNKYLAVISHHVVAGRPDVREALVITLD